jgi:hypothetical protein
MDAKIIILNNIITFLNVSEFPSSDGSFKSFNKIFQILRAYGLDQ